MLPKGRSVEANSSFSCYTDVFRNDTKAIKLFLPEHRLEVICHLYDYNKPDTKENRRKNLLLYTSAGLAPSIQIFNSTYSKVFYFEMSTGEDVDSWSISIPREEITYNTDIAPIEEWFVKFNMHHGLNMFTTEGTLLDIMREPILQWVGKLGVVLGITDTGFMSRDTKWYNLSDTICTVLEDDCAGLALVDVILINTRLIILTTLGLFISDDLRYPPESGQVLRDDYFRARIWYSRQCLANREKEEVDYVGLSFNKDKTLSQNRALVSVHKLEGNELRKQRKFPAFWFPDLDFIPFGMFFHPGSHFLYAYGNQVWISYDGGNVFTPIMKLENETIVETDTCVYTQAIVFVSDKGTIFYTKAGMQKYARLRVTPGAIFSMYFDHLGTLNYIVLNSSSTDDVVVSEMDVNTLLKGDDLGFNAALAVQYITEEQIVFSTNIFKPTDVEKTVVIPGMSSFLIIQFVNDTETLGHAVMPNQVVTGRAYQVFHRQLMRVVVGRPTLLDVDTTDYWDDSDSYVIHITVQSRFFEKGKTSIAVIIRYASLICDVTTIILTMKNSCSYLKTMHYVLPVEINEEDWLSNGSVYKHNITEGSRLLKNLPVNYRPPSVLGIAVPLTENFYNVDPSKPRTRDYFSGSKATGKYKQCANKTTRADCKCTSNMKVSFSVAFSDCKEKEEEEEGICLPVAEEEPMAEKQLILLENDTAMQEQVSEGTIQRNAISASPGRYKSILGEPAVICGSEKELFRVQRNAISASPGRYKSILGEPAVICGSEKELFRGTNLTSSTLKMKKLLERSLGTELYNPEGLTISIMGSELFHFRVSTIPGASFCNLFDEFQIFVDDPPLAFPGQYLISTITAVAIGGIIFMAFILHVGSAGRPAARARGRPREAGGGAGGEWKESRRRKNMAAAEEEKKKREGEGVRPEVLPVMPSV
nr:cation channel sperm-associated auxiliary subunit beta [Anolis sagrei ordinatus]